MFDIIIASFLDILLGDPYNFPHPVRAMGSIISFQEKCIRKVCHSTSMLQFFGLLMTLVNIFFGFAFPFLLLKYTHGILHHVISIYIIYTSISGKMLAYEAKKVKEAFKDGVVSARKQLSYIVGRDTKELSIEDIVAATIETVAENTSDGVISPLFYVTIFGPAGGWMYKFVNTMDSMIAYRNEKYEHLGKASAIIDDIFNYIPARLTAVLMLLSTFWKYPYRRALYIVKRDHGNHLSPNAGYPESAVAGLLGVQLGGGHFYFGKFVDKPTIGDKIKIIDENDIDRVIEILFLTMALGIILSVLFYKIIHM